METSRLQCLRSSPPCEPTSVDVRCLISVGLATLGTAERLTSTWPSGAARSPCSRVQDNHFEGAGRAGTPAWITFVLMSCRNYAAVVGTGEAAPRRHRPCAREPLGVALPDHPLIGRSGHRAELSRHAPERSAIPARQLAGRAAEQAAAFPGSPTTPRTVLPQQRADVLCGQGAGGAGVAHDDGVEQVALALLQR